VFRAALYLIFFLWLPALILPCHGQQVKVAFQVFTASLPDSAEIYIAGNHSLLGEWHPGAAALEKQPDGSWRRTFEFSAGTHLEYKFTKGTWQTEALDSSGNTPPNHILDVKNDTTLVFKIAGWKEETGEPLHTITGTARFHRKMRGEGIKPRDIIVWLPPGYESDLQKRYPVLYMHDGQNVFDAVTSFLGSEWRVDEAADSLIRNGEMETIIIVGIYNSVDRKMEYADTTAGHAYMNFLANTLKPFIDSTYRTLPGREHTATMGSSLGGLISFLLAWYHPDVFSQAGCVSPAFLYQNYSSVNLVENYRGPDKNIRIYMDQGAIGLEDTLTTGCQRMLKALEKQGFEPGKNLQWFYDETGEHSERSWARRVWRPLLFMYGIR